jgi:hypothetical protein
MGVVTAVLLMASLLAGPSCFETPALTYAQEVSISRAVLQRAAGYAKGMRSIEFYPPLRLDVFSNLRKAEPRLRLSARERSADVTVTLTTYRLDRAHLLSVTDVAKHAAPPLKLRLVFSAKGTACHLLKSKAYSVPAELTAKGIGAFLLERPKDELTFVNADAPTLQLLRKRHQNVRPYSEYSIRSHFDNRQSIDMIDGIEVIWIDRNNACLLMGSIHGSGGVYVDTGGPSMMRRSGQTWTAKILRDQWFYGDA